VHMDRDDLRRTGEPANDVDLVDDVRGPSLLLTVEAAAALLSLGRTTVYELLASGELASVKIGRSRRISYDALRLFVDRLRCDSYLPVAPTASPCRRAA
jgi:excisionase family DNA binding protein